MNDNASLQAQIDVLKKRLDLLNVSSTIPIETERAFTSRGFLETQQQVLLFNALEFGPTSTAINLSGDPEVILTMGAADAWGQVNNGPLNGYIIPLYVKPRTF